MQEHSSVHLDKKYYKWKMIFSLKHDYCLITILVCYVQQSGWKFDKKRNHCRISRYLNVALFLRIIKLYS